MYVCICRAVTDHQIRAAAEEGVRTMRELTQSLGVASCCGKCGKQAREILQDAVTAAETAPRHRMPALRVVAGGR